MALPFFWSGSWLSHTSRERVAIISVEGRKIGIYIYVALMHAFCMHGGSFMLRFVNTLINHTTDGVMSFLKATVNKWSCITKRRWLLCLPNIFRLDKWLVTRFDFQCAKTVVRERHVVIFFVGKWKKKPRVKMIYCDLIWSPVKMFL